MPTLAAGPRRRAVVLLMLMLMAVLPVLPALAQTSDDQSWVQRSNGNAAVLLEVMARFAPEGAARMGVPGLDEEIFDLEANLYERQMEAARVALETLRQRLAEEQDPAVRQDLEILISTTEDHIESGELQYQLMLPYFSMSSTVFQGIRALLDEQIPEERQQAALVRLKKYAGVEKGYTPITELAKDRIRERLAVASLTGPYRAEIEKGLNESPTFIEGIGQLFEKHKIKGYKKAYKKLKGQLVAYDEFVRAEIMPRARDDYRQPAELYSLALKNFGVDMSVEELQSRAQASFREIQNQMQNLAPLVAKEKGWNLADYRDVINELKKKQIVGKAILPHYEARIKQLEEIIRRERIVTLPDRDMQIRLASEAESAAVPAPNMRPPRMIGNTGEFGTFVLPLKIPGEGGKTVGFDDFTYEAASWTLTAHEGRPGHELQFAAMIEKGVSIPRAIFAMNSTNVEGWALYAEAEAMPYEPLEGQLVALQHRLLRAARAHLDPGLQLGTITKEEATRVLREDVGLSEPMTMQEIDRYTFRMPGQATAYFTGYQRLLELRTMTERKLGSSFDRMKFNDFILAQGALPPRLLRKAVVESFIPGELGMSADTPAAEE